MTNPKTLHRSDNRMIAGVCAGLAEYLGVDVTLVRVLTAATVLFGGTGILLYIAAWVIMPDSSGAVVGNWRPPSRNTTSGPTSPSPTTQADDTTNEPPFSV